MTVGRLKEWLENVPDELEIKIHDCFFGDRIIGVNWISTKEGKYDVVCLQTDGDFDVQEELKARTKTASEELLDEDVFFTELYLDGFTPDDFFGMDNYEYVKSYMEEHGFV